jgi:hypothetical protein
VPLSRYDRLYGGKPGGAAKAFAAMRGTYGERKGRQVFFSVAAQRKREVEGKGGLVRAVRSRG